jgi:hypothetical protein
MGLVAGVSEKNNNNEVQEIFKNTTVLIHPSPQSLKGP